MMGRLKEYEPITWAEYEAQQDEQDKRDMAAIQAMMARQRPGIRPTLFAYGFTLVGMALVGLVWLAKYNHWIR